MSLQRMRGTTETDREARLVSFQDEQSASADVAIVGVEIGRYEDEDPKDPARSRI